MKYRAMLATVLAVALVVGASWAASFPTGKFESTVGKTKWSITCTDKGTYSVAKGGRVGVEGKYTVKGSEVTLTDTGGPGREKGDKATGVYSWQFKHNTLTLTAVKDAAAGHKRVLTTAPWTKAE